jgi:hypothetical protein
MFGCHVDVSYQCARCCLVGMRTALVSFVLLAASRLDITHLIPYKVTVTVTGSAKQLSNPQGSQRLMGVWH